MTKRKPLEWYVSETGLPKWPLCTDCMVYMQMPGLLEACASVGIEHGKSTGLMLREHIDAYHARGHRGSE